MIVDRTQSIFILCILFIVISVATVINSQFSFKNKISVSQSPITPSVHPTDVEYIVITETPIPTATPKPTLTPTHPPKIVSSSQTSEWVTKYSNLYSVSRDLLWKIGTCESGFNSKATNGIYGGIFQFSEESWISIRRAMNLPDNPILRFDEEESIKTAAYKLSTGGVGAWPNCGK